MFLNYYHRKQFTEIFSQTLLNYYYLESSIEIAKLTNQNISWSIFLLLWHNPYYMFLILIGLLFLFCDAPFIDFNQRYIIIRSGKKIFLIAQVIYIIFTTIVYMIINILFTIIIIFPYIHLSIDWGKVVYTFSRNSMYSAPMIVSFQIVENYSPIEAFFITVSLAIVVGIILGLVTLRISIYSKKLGITISGLIIISSFLFNPNAMFSLPMIYIFITYSTN